MLFLQLDQQSAALAHRSDPLPETLFQELPVGVLVVGVQGEIRFVNQAVLRLLGLTESQLLGQTPFDPEWQIVQEDGTPFPVKLQSTPERAKQAWQLLLNRQPLGNLVVGVDRPTRSDRPFKTKPEDLVGQTPVELPLAPTPEASEVVNTSNVAAPLRSLTDQACAWAHLWHKQTLNTLPTHLAQDAERVWLSINTQPQYSPDGRIEQVICILSDITNLKMGEQLARIHECFSSLGADPDENINHLTALAGELLGGAWAVYNRQYQGLLWALGQWRTPSDFNAIGEPKNSICNDVIKRSSDQVLVVQDLQNTTYAQSNPDIASYQLQTYLGQAVKCAGEAIGALYVVYQHPFVPSQVDKKLLGIIAAAIGVEEEHKREAVVWAQNEAKWRSLIQTSSNLITIVEAEGTIRYVSPAIQTVLGYKPTELIGKNTFELVHPEDVSCVKNHFRSVVKAPTIDSSIEFRVQHRDGSWRYLESTYSNLLMDAPGVRIVINSRDITQRKQAETAIRQSESQLREKAEQLEEALNELQDTQTQLIQTEKMSSLGLLVAGIAHEINNPVSFIYGNIPHANQYARDLLHLVKLYQEHYPQPVSAIQAEMEKIDLEFLGRDLPKVMESMQMGAERIRQIVLSLRNFSRVDKAAREPVDLHQGIDNTLLLLEHRLKAKAEYSRIRIIREYGDLPLVECYAGQLNQVFMNILSNAIDALEESRVRVQESGLSEQTTDNGQLTADKTPTIWIHTELGDSNTAIVCIADNGSGIPPQMQQQIFDPFFTTKPVGKGTGLGLSISYQIVVEKHGGQLKCFSTPEEGTEFCIELPIHLPDQQAA